MNTASPDLDCDALEGSRPTAGPTTESGSRTSPNAFVVNFHGIGLAGRPFDAGEQAFWLTGADFEASLEVIRRAAKNHRVAVTFDDGNISDLSIAAPALLRHGIAAGFFIVAGRVGQPSFLARNHVRDLSAAGFEIGSHGFDHVDWTTISDRGLEREVRASKDALEDVVGAPVRRAAIPFGRYDRRVLLALQGAGYDEVLSSDGGPRLTARWPVPRRSMRDGVGPGDLPRLIAAGSGSLSRLRCEARLTAKALLPRRRTASPALEP